MKTVLKRKLVQMAGKTGTVTEVEDLSPRIRRIRIEAPSLVKGAFVPGDKIKLQAGTVMRSYTPSRVDTEAGWLDVIAFLHGQGPAARWFSEVAVGVSTSFFGPVRSIPSVEASYDSALFVGDETTIGLALALVEAKPNVEWRGAIECDPQDARALHAAGLDFEAVPRGELGAFIDAAPDDVERWWVSGEAHAVVDARARLLKRGVPRDRLRAKAYWSREGTAHRKRTDREVLRG